MKSYAFIVLIAILASCVSAFEQKQQQQQQEAVYTLRDLPYLLNGVDLQKKFSATTACPFSGFDILTEFVAFSELKNLTAQCAMWPQLNPCVPEVIQVLSSGNSPKVANQMKELFGMYQQICVSDSNGNNCANISDVLTFHDNCYSQVPDSTTKLCPDSKTCVVSASGSSCIPRATQEYWGAYCTGCFDIIRTASLNYYKFLLNTSNSGSASAASSSNGSSWTFAPPATTTGNPSGENQSTASPNWGIVMSEAGFAAANARESAICGTYATGCNSQIGIILENGISQRYDHALTNLLFDFSPGSANYFTSNNLASIGDFEQYVCAWSTDERYNNGYLRCLRRFVVSILSTNSVLKPFFLQSCQEGRKESQAQCELEAQILDFRLSFWSSDAHSSYQGLCNQTGPAAPSDECLVVPSATSADPSLPGSCWAQAFNPNIVMTTQCNTTIQSVLTSWGCCVQTLIDPSAPNLNPSVASWVRNFIATQINTNKITGCTSQQAPIPANIKYNFGIKFKHVAYADLVNNESLWTQVRSAVVTDFISNVGITRNYVTNVTLLHISPSSEYFFYAANDDTNKNDAVADIAGVLIQANFITDQEANRIAFHYYDWIQSAAPVSPELDTIFVSAGYQQPGSSSVAEYAVPPAPGQPTPPPTSAPTDTNAPVAPKSNEPAPSNNGDKTPAIIGGSIAGIVVLLLIGLFMGKKYRASREYNGGDTASEGSYLQVH